MKLRPIKLKTIFDKCLRPYWCEKEPSIFTYIFLSKRTKFYLITIANYFILLNWFSTDYILNRRFLTNFTFFLLFAFWNTLFVWFQFEILLKRQIDFKRAMMSILVSGTRPKFNEKYVLATMEYCKLGSWNPIYIVIRYMLLSTLFLLTIDSEGQLNSLS